MVTGDVQIADIVRITETGRLNVTGDLTIVDTLVVSDGGSLNVLSGCATFQSSSTLVLNVNISEDEGSTATLNPITYSCHSGQIGSVETNFLNAPTDPCKSVVAQPAVYGSTGVSVSVDVVDTCLGGPSVGVIAGVIAGVIVLVGVGLGGCLGYRRWQDRRAEESSLSSVSHTSHHRTPSIAMTKPETGSVFTEYNG